jgi:formylmethanofuran dehydrogenase subunit A
MIAQIGPHLGGGDATIIDAAGMIVMPGLIDTQEAARLKLRGARRERESRFWAPVAKQRGLKSAVAVRLRASPGVWVPLSTTDANCHLACRLIE